MSWNKQISPRKKIKRSILHELQVANVNVKCDAAAAKVGNLIRMRSSDTTELGVAIEVMVGDMLNVWIIYLHTK